MFSVIPDSWIDTGHSHCGSFHYNLKTIHSYAITINEDVLWYEAFQKGIHPLSQDFNIFWDILKFGFLKFTLKTPNLPQAINMSNVTYPLTVVETVNLSWSHTFNMCSRGRFHHLATHPSHCSLWGSCTVVRAEHVVGLSREVPFPWADAGGCKCSGLLALLEAWERVFRQWSWINRLQIVHCVQKYLTKYANNQKCTEEKRAN